MNLETLIIGSWEFVQSELPEAKFGNMVYHFTSDQQHYWEYCTDPEKLEPRHLAKALPYRTERDELVVTWSKSEMRHAMEDEGELVRMGGITGHDWWMRKLAEPKPFMKYFVGRDGELREIGKL